MRDTFMKEKVVMILGAGFIVGFFFYGTLMQDSALCYKVPACPAIRTVLHR